MCLRVVCDVRSQCQSAEAGRCYFLCLSVCPAAATVRMAPRARSCGTPGCRLHDFHNGPCENQEPVGTRPKPTNFDERKKAQRANRPHDAEGKRPKRPKPTVPAFPAEPPPEQCVAPSGLSRFYHTHRWGVPLPLGPVAEDANSDDELDESWRLSETEERLRSRSVRVSLTGPGPEPEPDPKPHQERLRSRGVASAAEVEFMMMWNSDRQAASSSKQQLAASGQQYAAESSCSSSTNSTSSTSSTSSISSTSSTSSTNSTNSTNRSSTTTTAHQP